MSAGAVRNILIALLFAVVAFAEDAKPELQSLKDSYDARVAELVRNRGERIAGKTDAYLKLLAEALAGATDAKAAEAIKLERTGVMGGLLAPATIPDLPEPVASAHRSFFGSVNQDSVDYNKAKKDVAAKYVKDLQSLSAKFRKDAALLRQIAAEKHRALYGFP